MGDPRRRHTWKPDQCTVANEIDGEVRVNMRCTVCNVMRGSREKTLEYSGAAILYRGNGIRRWQKKMPGCIIVD